MGWMSMELRKESCVKKPEQDGHVSIREFLDSSVIEEEQVIPGYSLLCLCKKYLIDRKSGKYHNTNVHIKHCIVVDHWKVLMCKCSEVRSHGTDFSTHNHHFHCPICYQPFDQPWQRGNHMIVKHQHDERSVNYLFKQRRHWICQYKKELGI